MFKYFCLAKARYLDFLVDFNFFSHFFLLYSLDQKIDQNSSHQNSNNNPQFTYKDRPETEPRLSESEGDESLNSGANLKNSSLIEQNQLKEKLKKKTSSNLPSPTASSADNSSLCALETNLAEDKEQQFKNELKNQLTTNQQWHEKPRSLSASSGEAFYYNQQQQHLTNVDLHSTAEAKTSSVYHHYSNNKTNSANQSPCCCCYNNKLYNTNTNIYSRSNSGSSSHDSISVSQLSVSTSTAAISSTGSILSTTPNNQNTQQQITNTQLTTTTQVTLVSTTASSSINQQNQSIISFPTSIQQSTATAIEQHEQQRSRSSAGSLFSIGSEQIVLVAAARQSTSPRTSPPVLLTAKQIISLTKSEQNTTIPPSLRQVKSQKQKSRRPTNNRLLTNESATPETQQPNNRSMRSRNLILQHQLHKSISTPTLIVHEEQTANQTNDVRTSALSKIKNKFTGNSSNSNISALKAGTSSLFSTVRDKLLQHEYVYFKNYLFSSFSLVSFCLNFEFRLLLLKIV